MGELVSTTLGAIARWLSPAIGLVRFALDLALDRPDIRTTLRTRGTESDPENLSLFVRVVNHGKRSLELVSAGYSWGDRKSAKASGHLWLSVNRPGGEIGRPFELGYRQGAAGDAALEDVLDVEAGQPARELYFEDWTGKRYWAPTPETR